jgi:FlhB-like protein
MGMKEKNMDGRQKAVALRYKAGVDSAPRILAKGQGFVAERIIELARENGVQVHEDPDLVGLLSRLDIQSEIPDNLYKAVAEVLAFVYRLNNRIAASK